MHTLQDLCLDYIAANASCYKVCDFEGICWSNVNTLTTETNKQYFAKITIQNIAGLLQTSESRMCLREYR